MDKPFLLALVTTQYSPISHSDVIVSRWLEPLPTDGAYGWAAPRTRIASMFVEQILDNDMSAEISKKHDVPRFSSVRGALTLGQDELAVDAVFLIGEHGNYPRNQWGQKLYPRKELFDQVVEVFRESGRVVPVFFDKHFSWDPAAIHAMYRTVREMKIPFFGGSSVSHCPLSVEIPIAGPPMEEMVVCYWNEVEDYLFHSLEFSRSVLERSPHAPSKVTSITAWQGEGVWQALDRGSFCESLFEAAARAVSPEALEAIRRLRRERGAPIVAFQLNYADGFKETHVMQNFVRKWSVGCRRGSCGDTSAAYALTGTKSEFFSHFARLNRITEDFFLSGQSPISLNRLYLTSMATAACMRALAKPGVSLPVSGISVPPPEAYIPPFSDETAAEH